VKGQSRYGYDKLNPGNGTAKEGQAAADRLGAGQDSPSSSRCERLPQALPLVLTDRTAAKQAMGVLAARFTCSDFRPAPDPSLKQEVAESSYREGQNRGQPQTVKEVTSNGQGQVASVARDDPGERFHRRNITHSKDDF
jgi:hypothetical protein